MNNKLNPSSKPEESLEETNQDDALWRSICQTVRPLSSKTKAPEIKNVSLEKKLTLTVKPIRKSVEVDYKTHSELKEGSLDNIDKKTAQRFKNGEMVIESVLDLHGYTLESAFKAVKNFIYAQKKKNARCLLIITGKGGSLGFGEGVLKKEFSSWMNHIEIRSLILSYTKAKPKDGGEGAFYVLLKRTRS